MFIGRSELTVLVVAWLVPAGLVLIALLAGARVRRILVPLVVVYAVGVVVLILWPLRFEASRVHVEAGNWIPLQGSLGFVLFGTERQMELGARDVLANVVAFVPLGLLLPFAPKRWRGAFVFLLPITALAVALELVQGVAVAQRTFDVDDAIAGAAGGAAALLVAAAAHRLRR